MYSIGSYSRQDLRQAAVSVCGKIYMMKVNCTRAELCIFYHLRESVLLLDIYITRRTFHTYSLIHVVFTTACCCNIAALLAQFLNHDICK